MLLRVISYNLKAHTAYDELCEIVMQYQPDILCLQETRPSDTNDRIGSLRISVKTEQGRYGLAIYYDPVRFASIQAERHLLGLSPYEQLFDPNRERFITSILKEKSSGTDIIVGCFHATQPGSATNRLRKRQIKQAINVTSRIGGMTAGLLIGDYNYPYGISSLRKLMLRSGYVLAVPEKQTFQNNFYSGQLDFAAAIHVDTIQLETLPFGVSDHSPILCSLEV